MVYLLYILFFGLVLSLFLLLRLFYLYRSLKKQTHCLPLKARGCFIETTQKKASLVLNKGEVNSNYILKNDLFERLQAYLLTDRNFAKTELETNKLVAELSTNRSYLFDAVKFATGMTLQDYLTSLRMEESKHLLETTDEVIETIAAVCGYNSVRTFYRLFRSTYHMTPAMYRKMRKEKANNNIQL